MDSKFLNELGNLCVQHNVNLVIRPDIVKDGKTPAVILIDEGTDPFDILVSDEEDEITLAVYSVPEM